MKILARFILFVSLPLVLAAGARAASFASASYRMDPCAINFVGRSTMSSAGNVLHVAAGETAVSSFTSANNFLHAGVLRSASYPSVITALGIRLGMGFGELVLSWAAPGSDGFSGTCAAYDIRYSTKASEDPGLSESQFLASRSVREFSPMPSPSVYGSAQSITVTGLNSASTYYFAIKQRDSDYSWSFVSTGAFSNLTLILSVSIGLPADYAYGDLDLGVSSVSASGLTITSGSNVAVRYKLRCSTVTAGSTWTPGASPSTNVFTVKAAFHASRPADGAFGAEDAVLSADQYCGASAFTADGTQRGDNVDPNGSRLLWHRMSTPTDSSVSGQQNIRVYITAEQNP